MGKRKQLTVNSGQLSVKGNMSIRHAIESLEPRRLLTTIYVDLNSPGPTHNGTSWTNAYVDLQQAISVSLSGDTIKVADGTYKPTSTTSRTISFAIKSGVTVSGSFAGYGAADPEAQDLSATPTILSGEIGSTSKLDNSYHVVTTPGVNTSTKLTFVVVRDGTANGNSSSSQNTGGALFSSSGTPVISDCNFLSSSSGGDGGAVYSTGAIVFTRCVFITNSTGNNGGAVSTASGSSFTNCSFTGNTATVSGGAITCASATYSSCTFTGNTASASANFGPGAKYGGAIYGSGTLTNCTFTSNLSTGYGGAIAGTVTCTTCTFTGNTAFYGGAVYQAGTFTSCTFSDSGPCYYGPYFYGGTATFDRCLFTRGKLDVSAGADASVHLISGDNTIRSCQFLGNKCSGLRAEFGATTVLVTGSSFVGNGSFSSTATVGDIECGGFRSDCSATRVTNCNFVANIGYYVGGCYLTNVPNTGTTSVTNSLFWHNQSPSNHPDLYASAAVQFISYCDTSRPISGTGNISADPVFVRQPGAGNDNIWGTADDDYGDLRTSAASPVIDAGNNSAVGIPSTDLAGNSRFVNVPGVVDTGVGTAPIVDIGVFEMVNALACLTGGPYSLFSGNSITLAGRGTSTASGSLQYAWEWTGDGLFNDATGANPVFFSNAFAPGSTLTIFLRVTDSLLHSVINSSTIYIATADVYVDTSATGSGTGATWIDAVPSLAVAINRVLSGQTIRIADGVYFPTYTGDRFANFFLNSNVSIYGGYAGAGAENPNARDPILYPTVLDGDLGVVGDYSDNSYQIFVAENLPASATIDGLTLTHGSAGRGGSGGMLLNTVSATISNCTFIDNRAYAGGAMIVFGSAPTKITNCKFLRNGISGDSAGAVYQSCAGAVFANCIFAGNQCGSQGGAMWILTNATTVANCIFLGNNGGSGGGGAIACSTDNAKITNCVFFANTAEIGSAIAPISTSSGFGKIYNSIFWNNYSPVGDQLAATTSNPAFVYYCDIQGGMSGTGNVNTDPLFLSTPSAGPDGIWGTSDDNYDVRLSPASPLVDAGINSAIPVGVTTDLNGQARYQDVPTTSDTGAGTAPIVDIGACEQSAALTSNPGGPYTVLTGQSITLSGFGADTVSGTLSFAWEWTGDGLFDDAIGANPVFDSSSFVSGSTIPLLLRVTNGLNQSTVSGTTVWVAPTIVYIDPSAPGIQSGADWYNAIHDLAPTLNRAVAGMTFHVADGLYKPSTDSSRGVFFRLKPGVALFGGYAGFGSVDPNVRSTDSYPSILSGEIGTASALSDNSFHVVVINGATATDQFDGFTITSGYGGTNSYNALFSGGGLYCTSSSTTIVNLTFLGNYAHYGGGAIFTNASTNLTLQNCRFIRNSSAYGGAAVDLAGPTNLIGCNFFGNYGAPALYPKNTTVSLVNSVFVGNRGLGSIYNFQSTVTINDSVIAYNDQYGFYNYVGSYPTMANMIIWGNPSGVFNSGYNSGVNYSDVQDSYFGYLNISINPLFVRAPSKGADNTWGTADDDYGDLRLQPGSPCIDTGNNASIPAGVTTDIRGKARIIDYPGNVPGAVVDMGAYEKAIDFIVAGTGLGDDFYANQSADQSAIQIWNSLAPIGGPNTTLAVNTIETLTFDTGAGDDSLEVDIANGMAVPIAFAAGADADRLLLTGSNASTSLTVASNAVAFGTTAITTSGNEKVILDGPASSAMVFASINLTDKLAVNAGKNLVVDTTSLSITGGGQLDITDGAVVVRTTGALPSITTKILAGQNGFDNINGQANWNGNGIVSSTARALNVARGVDVYAVGAIRNGDLDDLNGPGSRYTTWRGRSVGAEDVLIRFTYTGDADMNGTVTIDDYNMIDGAVLGLFPVRGWLTGDGDFNGSITIDDYNAIDIGYLFQAGSLGM